MKFKCSRLQKPQATGPENSIACVASQKEPSNFIRIQMIENELSQPLLFQKFQVALMMPFSTTTLARTGNYTILLLLKLGYLTQNLLIIQLEILRYHISSSASISDITIVDGFTSIVEGLGPLGS